MSKSIVFQSARVFDGESETLREGVNVVVENGLIREISARPAAGDAEVVDCGGRFLMPGLIDAHVHVYAAGLNIVRVAQSPVSYLAHFAAQFMRSSLDRGFTTLRDVGGADVGLASAIRDGLAGSRSEAVLRRPRHLANRRPRRFPAWRSFARFGTLLRLFVFSDPMAVIADGADAVRKAVREELRRGASHIKIMASGGVASPTDPLDRCQYSDDEIRAAVEEADRAGSYVAAHCHPTGSGSPRRGAGREVDRACHAHRSRNRRICSRARFLRRPHHGRR